MSKEGIAFSNGYFHTIDSWLSEIVSNPSASPRLEIGITFTKHIFIQALVRNLPLMFPGHHLSSEVKFDDEIKECTLTLNYHSQEEI